MLQAVEFEAILKNGAIQIPAEYVGRFKDRVRVILLSEDEIQAVESDNFLEQAMANPVKIEGFRPMTREEVYEGR